MEQGQGPFTFQFRLGSGQGPVAEGDLVNTKEENPKVDLLRLQLDQGLVFQSLREVLRMHISSGVKDLTISWTFPFNGEGRHCQSLSK